MPLRNKQPPATPPLAQGQAPPVAVGAGRSVDFIGIFDAAPAAVVAAPTAASPPQFGDFFG
eukprot:4251141-Lingulodinium_polyedra.AAC.1